MADVIMYTQPNCKFCNLAKELAEERGDFLSVRCISNPLHREQMFKKVPNAVTVPQIFVDGEHIGGYTEFSGWSQMALDVRQPVGGGDSDG